MTSAYDGVRSLYKKIPADLKTAFACTVPFGLLAHLFVYMNGLYLGDGTPYYYRVPGMEYSGRWLMNRIQGLTNYVLLNWPIAVLELFFLSLAVFVLYKIFAPSRFLSKALMAGMVVVYPTVTATHAYMLSAAGYAIGMLLSFLAAYVVFACPKWWGGALASVALIVLFCSIYQAYICCTAALMVLLLIKQLLLEDEKPKKTIASAAVCAASLGVGMLAYYELMRWLAALGNTVPQTRGISLSGVLGRSVAQWVEIIKETYVRFFAVFFQKGSYSFITGRVVAANWGLLMVGVLLLALLIFRKKLYRQPLKLVLLAALFLVLPVAVNLFYPILYNNDIVHVLMMFSFALPVIFTIALADWAAGAPHKAEAEEKKAGLVVQAGVASWVMLLCVAVLLFNNWMLANTTYTHMNRAYNESLSVATRLVDEMERTEGYERGMPVAIVGTLGGENYPFDYIGFDEVIDMVAGAYPLSFAFPEFLPWFLEEQMNFAAPTPDEAQRKALEDSGALEEMPHFPTPGYTQVMDGVMVLKLGPNCVIAPELPRG